MEMPRPDKPNWPTMHVIMMFITNAVELVLPTSINFTCPDASRWHYIFCKTPIFWTALNDECIYDRSCSLKRKR